MRTQTELRRNKQAVLPLGRTAWHFYPSDATRGSQSDSSSGSEHRVFGMIVFAASQNA
ncbi:MAG: hypothetical protein AAFQ68_23730 [Bacteroidota bacterium]